MVFKLEQDVYHVSLVCICMYIKFANIYIYIYIIYIYILCYIYIYICQTPFYFTSKEGDLRWVRTRHRQFVTHFINSSPCENTV